MSGLAATAPAVIETSSTTLSQLLPDILALILHLTEDFPTNLNARCSATALRGPAASLIRALLASDGVLSSRAWKTFRAATTCRTAHNGPATPTEYHQNILALLETLPQQVKHLIISARLLNPTHRPSWKVVECQLFAEALRTSPCCSSLQGITIEQSITTAAAGSILSSLPALQHLHVRVYQPDGQAGAPKTWKPAAQQCTSLLHLQIECRYTPALSLDLSGLAQASKLQALHTKGAAIVNLAAISSFQSLEHLSIEGSPGSFQLKPDIITALAQLRHLRRLNLPEAQCSAEGWRALATLRQLRSLSVMSFAVDASAPAAAVQEVAQIWLQPDDAAGVGAASAGRGTAAARPSAGMHIDLEHEGEGELAGCLARQMPCLRSLGASTSDLAQLASALQGHPQLRELVVQGRRGEQDAFAWPGQLLARLPALQALSLGFTGRDPEALLGDVTGCSRLTYLSLTSSRPKAMLRAGLAALASGPCSDSLRVLELHGNGQEAGPTLQLLAGGMPELRSASLMLSLPAGARGSKEEAAAYMEGVLAGAGGGGRRWGVQVEALNAQVGWCRVDVYRH